MDLIDQVCSSELAIELKELGVKQESLFYHTHSKFGVLHKSSIDFTGDPTSAFTVAELGELLPDEYQVMHTKFKDGVFGNQHVFIGCKVSLIEEDILIKVNVIEGEQILDETEANARAKMLIYLIKEGLIKEE